MDARSAHSFNFRGSARLLNHSHSRDHITSILQKLHWFPIQFQIKFEVLLMIYKALNNLIPPYITDLL